MDSSQLAQISDSTVYAKQALYSAFQIGELEDAATILRNHPELSNCELKSSIFLGTTLLLACGSDCLKYKATREDYYDIFHFMLDNGADPNCLGHFIWLADNYPDSGYTQYDSRIPLMVAAANRNRSLIEILLDAGAKINQTNNIGQTTLHVSCLGALHDHRSNIIEKLLSHNADVNVQDAHGRTALHYACENTRIGEVNILLEAGAQVNIADSSGFTELELAAQSVWDPLLKVQRLMDSFDYPTEAIIESFEVTAWSLIHKAHMVDALELGPAVDCMRKATLMRMEQNIPKKVSDPLECYGFTREWETLEELSRFEHSLDEVMLQAMLSRERIFRGRHRLIPLRQYTHFHHFLPVTGQQPNTLLVHILDLYEENSVDTDLEGYKVLLYFNDLLAAWFRPIFTNDSRYEFEDFDTSSIAKTVLVLTGNCQRKKELLENGTDFLLSLELVECLHDSIFILTGIIMKLYKRNRLTPDIDETEESLAKQMLRGVIRRISDVVSHPIDFQSPVQHIIIDSHIMKFCFKDEFYVRLFKDIDICNVLFDCIEDIDATNGKGYTLLLLVAEQICYDEFPISLNILNSLIDQGAYIYARNNEGMTVFDYLAKGEGSNEEESRTLQMLRCKVPPLQTLAAIRAKGMVLTRDIPDSIRRFIELH